MYSTDLYNVLGKRSRRLTYEMTIYKCQWRLYSIYFKIVRSIYRILSCPFVKIENHHTLIFWFILNCLGTFSFSIFFLVFFLKISIKFYLLVAKAWTFNRRLLIYFFKGRWKILKILSHNFFFSKHFKFKNWQNMEKSRKLANYFELRIRKNFSF